MKTMKRSILRAIPQVFSLLPNSDYLRFVEASRPNVVARANWERLGKRLQHAVNTFGETHQHGSKEAA
jgi:hypothetical protein